MGWGEVGISGFSGEWSLGALKEESQIVYIIGRIKSRRRQKVRVKSIHDGLMVEGEWTTRCCEYGGNGGSKGLRSEVSSCSIYSSDLMRHAPIYACFLVIQLPDPFPWNWS